MENSATTQARRRQDPPLLDVQDLAVRFKTESGEVDAVKDVSFRLYKGETIAVVGESGSGKSVTARAVMGLLTKRATVAPRAKILFNGVDVLRLGKTLRRRLRGDRIAMIFQEPMSSLNPVYTIGSQIMEALHVHGRLSRKEAHARAVTLLEEVRIPDPLARLQQYPHQLSGGQRQRVMIAMALEIGRAHV